MIGARLILRKSNGPVDLRFQLPGTSVSVVNVKTTTADMVRNAEGRNTIRELGGEGEGEVET